MEKYCLFSVYSLAQKTSKTHKLKAIHDVLLCKYFTLYCS
jgi:hypothetical protein